MHSVLEKMRLSKPTMHKQEAQLTLRNRALAMHFFVAKLLSIAVTIYSCICHLRNLRPADLLRTQRINFSMRLQHVRMTRDPTVVHTAISGCRSML